MSECRSSKRAHSPTGHPVTEQFSRNMLVVRERAGISQEEWAELSDLCLRSISPLETEGRMARVDTVIKLAGGLDLEPAELLKGIRWKAGGFGLSGYVITENALD
jgi:transcriptional regulator with XRE-family HTH domain